MALDAAFQAFNAQESLASRVVDLSLIPSQVTLQDINSLIRAHGQNDSLNTLRTTKAVLEARPELVSDASMRSTALETLSLVAELVYPTLDATQDGDNTNYGETSHRASIGVDIIHLISSQDGLDLPPPAIIALAAYTNQDDRWSDHELAESAQELLDRAFGGDDSGSGTKLQTFILDKVLQGFLRPLFSKSRPATVTASGRKAEFVQPSRYDNFNADAEANKPWKYQQRYAVTVFSWAVDHTDHETLRKNWHQYTPVLLTLLDETSTPFKLRALATFRTFWDRCPPEIMQQTGLAQVFEDAIFPAVLYLPGLTPEEESVQILDATYPALFAIAGVGSGHRRLEQLSDKQRRLLHRIVREGVLTAYHHSGAEHLRIAEVLCRQLRRVVNGMGILAVKHLKDMIPMLSAIISDPFAPSHPPSLAAALDALVAVQGSCWPRMPHYANDLIQMLMLCWMGVEEAQQEEEEGKARTESEAKFKDVVDKLRHNARMLGAILEAARASADGGGPADAGASARSTDTGPEGAAVAASRRAASASLDEGADIPGFRATLAERVQPLVEKHKSLGRLFMADDADA